MITKKYTHGVSVFLTKDSYDLTKKFCDQKEISISNLIRILLARYLSNSSASLKGEKYD